MPTAESSGAPASQPRRRVREYRYQVDRDGRVFHDGTEVVDPAVLAFFLGAMEQSPEGEYHALCQGEQNWFETADTPFVIQRIRTGLDHRGLASIELGLAGDYQETLVLSSLEARGDHLYCRVRGDGFSPASDGPPSSSSPPCSPRRTTAWSCGWPACAIRSGGPARPPEGERRRAAGHVLPSRPSRCHSAVKRSDHGRR